MSMPITLSILTTALLLFAAFCSCPLSNPRPRLLPSYACLVSISSRNERRLTSIVFPLLWLSIPLSLRCCRLQLRRSGIVTRLYDARQPCLVAASVVTYFLHLQHPGTPH